MRRYIILGVAAVIIVILISTLFILYQKGGRDLFLNILTRGQLTPTPTSKAGTIISFKVNKSANGSVLIVEWKRLPNGTNTLVIWKAPSGTKAWEIWKTLSITPGSEGGSSASIDIGKLNLGDYQFSVEAVKTTTSSDGTTHHEVLWTSPVFKEIVTPSGTIEFVYASSSTPVLPPIPPAGGSPSSLPPPTGGSNPPPTSPSPSPTPTPSPTPSPTPAPSPAPTPPPAGGSTPPPTLSANNAPTYYTYTPQQTPSAQTAPVKGSFWIQYVNQSIEIGWQNLPATTNKIIVSRSQNQNGTWTVVLTQHYPDPTGPYSIKLVDDTLNNPYYYKLDTYTNGNFTQTYGPEYLAPQ